MLRPMLLSVLAPAVLLALASTRGRAAQPAQAPEYSVAQIARDPARFTHHLSGQWLLVRGVVWGCDADMEGPGRRCISIQPLIADLATGSRLPVILGLDGNAFSLQHVRWGRPATYYARIVRISSTGEYAVDLANTDAARIYMLARG